MDQVLVPGKVSDTSIALQTRRGASIENWQSHEISQQQLRQGLQYFEKPYPRATFRTPPNPIYNCHGLTFASCRTGIYNNPSLRAILRDDGYTEVPPQHILPGDIILYFGESGDIEHSGTVVEVLEGRPLVSRVVSKWGKYKEVIHLHNDCPYDCARIRYYRVTE